MTAPPAGTHLEEEGTTRTVRAQKISNLNMSSFGDPPYRRRKNKTGNEGTQHTARAERRQRREEIYFLQGTLEEKMSRSLV